MIEAFIARVLEKDLQIRMHTEIVVRPWASHGVFGFNTHQSSSRRNLLPDLHESCAIDTIDVEVLF